MSELLTSFSTVISDFLTVHGGVVIERINSHDFRVGKNHYCSMDAAKSAIDSSTALQLSINRGLQKLNKN
ncbi:MAG TPA: hypothetical protein VF622_13860 [Segetibacter sp.]|jgi:hypothetical protein